MGDVKNWVKGRIHSVGLSVAIGLVAGQLIFGMIGDIIAGGLALGIMYALQKISPSNEG